MTVSVSVSQIDKAQKVYGDIKQYAMPAGLTEKCVDSGVFNSKSEYNVAADECKKWLALCVVFANSGTELGMISEKVDEVWHQFILFTLSYHNFCLNFNSGHYLHHVPNGDQGSNISSRQSVDNFKKAYEACFGKLNAIWPQRTHDIFSSCGADSGCGSSCAGCTS